MTAALRYPSFNNMNFGAPIRKRPNIDSIDKKTKKVENQGMYALHVPPSDGTFFFFVAHRE